jgi:hypothetical protein
MPATIRQVVDDALQFIGEVSGVGVEQYSEDRMFRDAIRGFDMLFKKRPWEQYRMWRTITLDGSTGVSTTGPFEQVIDFEDFLSVRRGGLDAEIPILPQRVNPNVLSGTANAKILFWSSLHVTHPNYVTKKLQFYPLTSTGTVDVLARVYPLTPPALEWDWEDTMYLDRSMLVYATAFMTLMGDDLNAGAASVTKTLLDMKFKDINDALAKHPIPVSGYPGIPTDWFVRY